MNVKIPFALALLAMVALALYYFVGTADVTRASPLGLLNLVGLAAVVIGLFAAGLILRRAAPQR